MNPAEPGLLAPASFQISGNQYAVAVLSDGTTYVLPSGILQGVTSRPARPGETITMYGVGFGSVIPGIPAGQVATGESELASPLQMTFGSTPATVQYQGLAPGLVGLYQFNIVVPAVPDSNLVPLTFSMGGVQGVQVLFTAVHH